MLKYRSKILSLTAVAASGTTIVDLPVGPRYRKLLLAHGFTSGTNTVVGAAANISNIKLKAGGRTQREMTGQELFDQNVLMGGYAGTTDAGYAGSGAPNTAPGAVLPIHMEEPWRKELGIQDGLSWCTNLWPTFQAEITFGAATSPTLQVFAVVDDFAPKDPGAIVRWVRFQATAATAYDWVLPERSGRLLSATIYPAETGSTTPSSVIVQQRNTTIYDWASVVNTSDLNSSGMDPAATGRTSGAYDLVFDADDMVDSGIDLSRGETLFRITNSGTASGKQVILAQILDLPR